MTCILCPIGCVLAVSIKNNEITVTENQCKRGVKYARTEIKAPRRTLTTTVRVVIDGKKSTAPVKTNDVIPKSQLFDAMETINKIELDSPALAGSVVVRDLLGSGVDVVLTDHAG